MSTPLKTIVIGTSLTEASDGVVRTGVALARATGASLWLVHAYVPYIPLAFPSGGGVDARWIEEQVRNLQEQATDQAQRTGMSKLAGFSAETVRLAAGAPHREIVGLASKVQADLILVGAAETMHGILGSTADRVIRKAPCPVLVVRSEAAFPPARVEFPIDLSPISANAFSQGLDFLAQLGVPLTEAEALFVLNPLEVAGSIMFTPEQIYRFASEELRRFLTVSSLQGTPPHLARVCTGFPREEILAALTERRVDLAVLGTHGRSGFERLMVGSVASEILRKATCNLLVVPPTASQQHQAAEAKWTGADWSYVSDKAPLSSSPS